MVKITEREIENFRRAMLRAKISLSGPDGSRRGVDGWIATVNAICEAARKGIGSAPLATADSEPPKDGDFDGALRYAIWLLAENRVAESEAWCRKVVEARPLSHDGHGVLGSALQKQGRSEEAIASLRRALEINPAFENAHSVLVYAMDMTEGSVEKVQAERRRYAEVHGRGPRQLPPRGFVERSPDRRIRVGWLSADFVRHSAMTTFSSIILRRDKAKFAAHLYSGVVGAGDDLTRELEDSADGSMSTLGVANPALAERIRRDKIDVLIDLSGYTGGSRITVFAHRPAPVQIEWGMGSGMKQVDWVVGDPTIIPERFRKFYSERVLDLRSYFCWEAPSHLPAIALVDEARPFTFGYFNRLEKLSDAALRAFAEILRRVPEARLLIKSPGIESSSIPRMVTELGVGPRVAFLGHSDHVAHLAEHGNVDLMLDPFPQTGGISTCESLAMGVPVVSLAGETFPSRGSASILAATGMEHMAVESVQEYVEKAVFLSGKRDAATRESLRKQFLASSAGNVDAYVWDVEAALRRAWGEFCGAPRAEVTRAKPPQDLSAFFG